MPAVVEVAPVVPSVLDILTFNTWGLPSPIAQDRRGRFPLISRFVAESGADVAGLQEVWRGALGLLSLDHLRVPDRGIDTGLVLVTPHPVEGLAVHAYAAERGFDAMKSKGVLQARVDMPKAGLVEVFVTHLQAGGGDKNARVRAAQARELLERVETVDVPVIVLGDFNLHAGNGVDERTWARLQAAGLTDAAFSVGEEGPTYLASDQRFDHVYLRDGGDVRLQATAAQVVPYDDDPLTVAPQRLSDHQPVRVRADVLR